MSYGIWMQYYYLIGNINGPEDGFILDECGNPYEFDTKKDALEFIKNYFGSGIRKTGPDKYESTGKYMLDYGEYERPDYWIRRVEDVDIE